MRKPSVHDLMHQISQWKAKTLKELADYEQHERCREIASEILMGRS